MLKTSDAFSGFSVNDLQKAKQFYSEVLGLRVEEDADMKGLLNLTVNEHTQILIYVKPDHVPATFTILNFRILGIEDVVSQLKKKGVVFEKYDQPNIKTDEDDIFRGNGMKIAWFKDPSGNILSLIDSKKAK